MTERTSTISDLQVPDISSTQDLNCCPLQSSFSIAGRRTYRKRFSYFYTSDSTAMTNAVSLNQSHADTEARSTRTALGAVLLIFLLSAASLLLVYKNMPNFTEDEWKYIKLPYSIEDAKNLGVVLNGYKTDHYFQVLAGVFVTYVFLQTFAIPGSLFLSILSGFLFPFPVALSLVCFCSALGASLCFLLSQLLGRKLVLKYYPQRAQEWAEQVHRHRNDLFNYVLFLRITPFLPNWFINLTAPVIGVPLTPFAVGTFIGVAPPSFIAIQGGQTLNNMTNDDFSFSWTTLALLILFGSLPLLPVIFRNKLKNRIE